MAVMRGATCLQEPAELPARLFTEFVRGSLTDARPDVAGEATAGEPRRLAAVVGALRTALRREMRRRGLWESPPGYLGIHGWESWSGGRPGSHERPLAGSGAFEELLAECFSFIFVERLRSLKAQLAIKPNIDGLVFLNIRHFLHDRQKEHDPLGFRVFEVVWAAVGSCLAAGTLHVLDGDPKVRNDTVLGFGPATRPPAAPPVPMTAPTAPISLTPPTAMARPVPVVLEPWVAGVDDALLPGLLTARGERQAEVVAELARRLPELRHEGLSVFRFKDLVDPFKDDVRSRWAAILRGDGGVEWEGGAAAAGAEGAGSGWMEPPGRGYEERESFRALVSCVMTALERLDVGERTRAQLTTLWQYLRIHSAEGGVTPPASADMAGRRVRRPGRPSDRTLADLLCIPREQLPQLFVILGRLVEGCRSGAAGLPRRGWQASRRVRHEH